MTATATTTRVVVADDSPVARRLIVRILGGEAGLDVVGEAADGTEAVRLVAELRPDVVAMDIRMPGMDGYEAARRIMTATPTPIVMVSAHERLEVEASFRAIDAGAVTVLRKPVGPGHVDFPEQAAELISTLRTMAGLKVVTRRAARTAAEPPPRRPRRRAAGGPVDIVAMGASTGGPKALGTILRSLPPVVPIPILIVQHITVGFEEGLVSWLDSISPVSVRLAEHGRLLTPGEVLVAPNGVHVGVSRGRVALSDTPPVGGHRPSATHLFTSVARAYGARALGIILTGIGRDGADGLGMLHAAGAHIIAQDEATSVVYSMPRAAAEAGYPSEVLPVEAIGDAMVRAWSR